MLLDGAVQVPGDAHVDGVVVVEDGRAVERDVLAELGQSLANLARRLSQQLDASHVLGAGAHEVDNRVVVHVLFGDGQRQPDCSEDGQRARDGLTLSGCELVVLQRHGVPFLRSVYHHPADMESTACTYRRMCFFVSSLGIRPAFASSGYRR